MMNGHALSSVMIVDKFCGEHDICYWPCYDKFKFEHSHDSSPAQGVDQGWLHSHIARGESSVLCNDHGCHIVATSDINPEYSIWRR